MEQLQGTLLQEHWGIQFRRRYLIGRRQLQHFLDAFLHFYNAQRPHSGYRLRARRRPETRAKRVRKAMSAAPRKALSQRMKEHWEKPKAEGAKAKG